MPDDDTGDPGRVTLDEVADHLYGLVPEDFVPAREDAVAAARARGERDLARALGRLRKPTRAAWLANLLARERGEQLDALLLLAADLADAQRTLDGTALRALSAQRHRLVTAMAREAGRLANARNEPAGESLLREVGSILDAALADPDIAAEVRSGRLTRSVTWSGFGPAAEPGASLGSPRAAPSGAEPRSAERAAPTGRADEADREGAEGDGAEGDGAAPDLDRREQERREQERREQERREQERRERERRERERRERTLATAEREEIAAHERQDAAEAEREDAEAAHTDARDRVAELTAELAAAREHERAAATRARTAAGAAKDAARAAGAAATATARARARLEELPPA